MLQPADAFTGSPDPSADFVAGVSETVLDLAGHHVITSGALCTGLGSELVPQLNVSTISLLLGRAWAPIIGDESNAPVLLQIRPLRALDFAIGEGTEESPSLQLAVSELEIDFYAFVLERYVRAFTANIAVDLGVNLVPTTTEDGAPALMPMLIGLDTQNIRVTALNDEILDQQEGQLETVLPAVLDLALPLVTGAIPAIELPDIVGFRLENIGISKVTTSEDDFLAVQAMLNPSPALSLLATKYPSVRESMAKASSAFKASERADTVAQLREVRVPAPEIIRAGLAGQPGGEIPQIAIDVESRDAQGRELEWTWNIDGGMWRQFTRAAPLVIQDRALVWQGHHEIGVRARVVGDYRTLDLDPVYIPVVIDSAPPTIHTERAAIVSGKLTVPASDIVTPREAIEMAFGHPGDSEPATDWLRGPIAIDEVRHLAKNGVVMVYARDEIGNTSSQELDLDSLSGIGEQPSGCGCSAGSTSAGGAAGALFLAALTLLLLGAGRQRARLLRVAHAVAKSQGVRRFFRAAAGAAVLLGMIVTPGCNCGDSAACAVAADCEVSPDCLEPICGPMNTCECPLLPVRVGRFSDMALTSNGEAWVSAYNEEQGDLCVTMAASEGAIFDNEWEFVDGVPSGPVIFEGLGTRGGIEADGEDVGKFTSVAINSSDEALISYFDEDRAALKFAARVGDAWQIHTVQEGKPGDDPAAGFEIIGQYSSITVRGDNGFPGIAYFAHVADVENDEVRTELRFASAQTALPSQPSDWLLYQIDQAVLPAPDPNNPDPFTIPPGIGLFVDSARLSDETPIVTYYDRINGDLKLSAFDLTAGEFAPPTVLDGADDSDVGWYPSIAVDADDTAHITYVSASNDNLLYINTLDNLPEVIDDGYRVTGTTPDGLPKPEFHRVGDDSSLVMTANGPAAVYQDATSHELLLATRDNAGVWQYRAIAGNETDFVGAYGFYASAAMDGDDVVISNWVLNPAQNRVWVEVFRTNPTAP